MVHPAEEEVLPWLPFGFHHIVCCFPLVVSKEIDVTGRMFQLFLGGDFTTGFVHFSRGRKTNGRWQRRGTRSVKRGKLAPSLAWPFAFVFIEIFGCGAFCLDVRTLTVCKFSVLNH